MNHEVIPTQADKICEQGIRDFLFHGEYLNGSIAAAHRLAHEAPLLAEIAELEQALIEADRKNDAQGYEWNRAEARIAELEGHIKALLPYVKTDWFGCKGDKCRMPGCYSCNGEDAAALALDAAGAAVFAAR